METSEARKRWAMLTLRFAARVGLGFQFQPRGSVADPLAAQLHLSFAEIGTLIGLFMLSGIFLAIPAGIAGRYASDRVLVAAGLACLALGGALAAAAAGFTGLAPGRLLCGAGVVGTPTYFTQMTAGWVSA